MSCVKCLDNIGIRRKQEGGEALEDMARHFTVSHKVPAWIKMEKVWLDALGQTN